MYNKILALLLMIFLHIVDDYYLQGILASMKQKRWWEENAPDKLYKYDYIMALFMHGFSWAFMVMIVPFIYAFNKGITINNMIYVFIFTMICHIIIDNAKANKKQINLIFDQLYHLLQILLIWLLIIYI